jgi:hypothetical protein
MCICVLLCVAPEVVRVFLSRFLCSLHTVNEHSTFNLQFHALQSHTQCAISHTTILHSMCNFTHYRWHFKENLGNLRCTSAACQERECCNENERCTAAFDLTIGGCPQFCRWCDCSCDVHSCFILWLLRKCECSCDVHSCSMHSARANFTINWSLYTLDTTRTTCSTFYDRFATLLYTHYRPPQQCVRLRGVRWRAWQSSMHA